MRMTPVEPPIPVHDPEEVRRLADEVLSRAEFDAPERPWLRRALDWFLRQLERLFGGDPDRGGFDLEPGGAGSGGSRWFTVVVLLAALALAVVAVRSLRRGWRRRSRSAAAALDVELEGRRSAQEWDRLAARLEEEGRWKDAMRARFEALVDRLADRGLVADAPGRTSGEYRLDVQGSLPEVARAFADAADLHDRAWYGDLPTGPPEAERFGRHASEVLAAGEAGR